MYDPEKYRGLRALILTRVSTLKQRDTTLSHQYQERLVREKLIEPLGLILDPNHIIRDTYTGLDFRYREALNRILELAEQKEFDVLCMEVLDRGLGRKGLQREFYRMQLKELGVRILTTDPEEHADDDSLVGEIIRLFKGHKAEEEINDLVRRTTNGKIQKALGSPEDNIPPQVVGSSSRPYGYHFTLDKKGKRSGLTPNLETIKDNREVTWTEVRVVKFIFRCAYKGIPIRRIAQRLNKLEIPAPSVSKGEKVKSKAVDGPILWQPAVISRMLRHTGYCGEYPIFKKRTVKVPGRKWPKFEIRPDNEQIKVPIPAIISKDMFEVVQQHLARNKKIAAPNNRRPEDALLRAGIAKCGHCGANLTVNRRVNHYKNRPEGQRDQIGYNCSRKYNGLYQCPGCYILVPILDQAAWNFAKKIVLNPSIIDKQIEERRSKDPTQGRRKHVKAKLAEIREMQNSLRANLARLYEGKILDPGTEAYLTNRLHELAKEEKECEAELRDEEKMRREWAKAQEKLNTVYRTCERIQEKINDPDYEFTYKEKRNLLEFLEIEVVVWEKNHDPRFEIRSNL
ncbi:recombinase-like zinc beta ribbon protein [Thermosporothrix hazakensis]|jgi:predicted RNA-binding Zn-ribbon protein involved in translation (DUF1610 family)|uniref:Recombinase-like zinc beta ribbon protein n=2 Tax=Thermosporothrix TaxID=768650 RepID=A0A326UA93_THEHA|nr:recombinase family protein [Thermosporothrix hazakensis]PZW32054.1 recombinase-like zinc beta ribbon protein [Thermosporothrix hazakensis]BBH91473.1 resolvase [Thermosporothrix sp. COM3]GCE49618.1 resolvase [Thermosporothrix hazakensis]